MNNTKEEVSAEGPAQVAIGDEIDASGDRTATYEHSQRGAIQHHGSDISRQIAQLQTPGRWGILGYWLEALNAH